ncbi:PLP-dependent aminotransferase family protein [Acinetobacter sp.]|uniref:aminotransferase-like domain-containing protein n=1 Tax=Acinetobacter sp. TaxID=472 RepID=UPI0035AE6449
MYKSELLAQNIRQLIENGSWQAHEKLPSLREQTQLSGYSLITVLNAYQELEAQGLLYAKGKSGYYVAERNKALPAYVPEVSLNTAVQINSAVFHYLKSIQTDGILPFGSAFPNPELLYNQKFMQLLAQHAKRKHSYLNNDNMPPGNLVLRTIIANRYVLQGVQCTPDDIVITSGALEALNLSLQALTRPGDFILLQQSVFYGAWQAAERLGLQVISIPEHPQLGFDLESFEQALKQYPIKVCWLMLNAQNPIGFTVNNAVKQRIAGLLHEYQVHLIEDDVYQELSYGGQRPLPMSYFDQHRRVLHCSSFSKTLGMGTRIGWVQAGPFSDAIQHLQLMSTLSASPLIQNALVDFLSHHHYEKHLRHLRKHLEKNKKKFHQFLKQHLPAGSEIYCYSSGYFLWLKLPDQCDSFAVHQQMLSEKIGVAPSLLFRPENIAQNFIRLNCSYEWNAEIEAAMLKLCACVARCKEKA